MRKKEEPSGPLWTRLQFPLAFPGEADAVFHQRAHAAWLCSPQPGSPCLGFVAGPSFFPNPDPSWLQLSRGKQGTFCDSTECRRVMLPRPKCASTEPLRDALLCDTQVTIQSLLTQLSKDNAQREFGGSDWGRVTLSPSGSCG